jgi:coenzyme F420-reducing hydrogenase delta subunit
VVALFSGYPASAAEWRGEADSVADVAEIHLPTVARLSTSDLLTAFEAGAERVHVIACHDGKDRYPQATLRTRRRVEQARKMLAEIGMDADRLEFVETADSGRDAIRAALQAAGEKVAAR